LIKFFWSAVIPATLVCFQLVAKLNENKLRIKNFIVDAKALQGEEEMKFLRRSFEDRDKKVKKFSPGE